jgi:hypothetical protein
MDMLTLAKYNVYRGTSSPGAYVNIPLDKANGIDDTQIQADIQSMINLHTVQGPDANRLYIVNVEPGVLITAGGESSGTVFLGYHSVFAGAKANGTPIDVHYAVISYPGFPNFTYLSQQFVSSTNFMTTVMSHEIAEAVTDPGSSSAGFLGWFDDVSGLAGENGDVAAFNFTTFKGFEVQLIAAPNETFLNPNGVSATLTAPTPLSLSKVNATTGKLTWGSVALAEGYRIFSISGTTRTLLTTVGPGATSVNLPALVPGSLHSYQVEAFNGTFVADSNVISGTAPFLPTITVAQSAAAIGASSASGGTQTSTFQPIYVAPLGPATQSSSVKPRNFYALGVVERILP